jgi:RHS repeat-associated protein
VTINGGQTSPTKYYTANGQRVAIRTDGVVSYLLPDTLGSVSLTLSADGSTESVQLYTPYGGVRYSDGSTPTVYGFTGQRFDSLTGLMYYVARYYDPISGRFTSADSVETNASGQDPYGYVKGNPETNTDPTGHALCPMVVDCGGGGGGGGSSHPNPPPNASSPPLGTGNTGSGRGGNSGEDGGGASGCIFELGCGGGTPADASDYPAGGSSNPNPPCTASCAERVATIAGAPLVFGIVILAFLSGGEDGEDESGSELFNEEMESLGEACSFVAATQVATDTGKHPIGSLKVGEKVVSYNPKSKKTELEVIRHVWINHDNDLVDLTLVTKTAATKSKPAHQSSETLHTNMKHPFLTVEKGFVPVAQLKPGMHVVEAGNRTGVVTGWKSVLGAQTMYNLEVTQDHTFTVGAGQFVVHNCGGFDRNITSIDELDNTIPSKLKYNSQLINAGRSGGNRPLTADPNSYYLTTGGHALVYDSDGQLIYDVSSERIKMVRMNTAPNGMQFPQDVKLRGSDGQTPVPSEWQQLLHP